MSRDGRIARCRMSGKDVDNEMTNEIGMTICPGCGNSVTPLMDKETGFLYFPGHMVREGGE